MLLLEYEAKNLLRQSHISVPKGDIEAGDKLNSEYPVVIKSQVAVGGRGKLGGVRIADTSAQAESISRELLGLEIKGHLPKVLLFEEKLDITREFYLSLMPNQQTGSIKLMAHKSGGVEVESHDSEDFFVRNLTKEMSYDQVVKELSDYYSLPSQADLLSNLIENLTDCMVKNDATLIEINPLVLTKNNQLVAADCKMELDNNAAFRHPDWAFEEEPADANFVTLNPKGNVATIANGAGLAMATVDAVANMDMLPANFLDIGGGANEASVTKAFKAITAYDNIQAIVINIFAGITRCDEVAKAIVGAKQHINNLPPLFIRLDGTNYNEAKAILDAANIELLPTLEDCLVEAKEVTS